MKRSLVKSHTIVWPLLVSSFLSVGLLACRVISGESWRYWFVLWNLFLAWLPLLFAFALTRWLNSNRWLSWKGVALTILWLGFLPNSFYLISDFIHLKDTGEVSILFDAVLFMTFAWNGLLLGFTAVHMVHVELLKRMPKRHVVQLIAITFILCSFAIYLGRYLEWNTWDILVNPAGILFDLSERVVEPTSYPSTFTTTALFAVTLSAMYYSVCKLIDAIRGVEPVSN